jgi:hypothetical protein
MGREADQRQITNNYYLLQEKQGKIRIELNGEVLYVSPDTYRIMHDRFADLMPKESER